MSWRRLLYSVSISEESRSFQPKEKSPLKRSNENFRTGRHFTVNHRMTVFAAVLTRL